MRYTNKDQQLESSTYVLYHINKNDLTKNSIGFFLKVLRIMHHTREKQDCAVR